MITGKIIEKAEEEEEDSDDFSRKESDEEYEEDFNFEQYQDINDEFLEQKNLFPAPHRSNLRDKTVNKRQRCEFCNLLIPSNKFERHIKECNNPQSKKLVLNVKSIKFAERVPKRKRTKNPCGYSESFESKIFILIK